MTAGFGVDPTLDANGNVIAGTTSDDIQRITGSLYTPGLISGGFVNRSSSALTYVVTSGVACITISDGKNILAPIPATTITVPSPVGSSRIDIIFARQRFPATDGDSSVIVDYGPTLPVGAVKLNAFTVPAGATNTNAATVSGYIDYSIPYGTTQGVLWHAQIATTGLLQNNLTRYGQGSIYVSTDRRLKFSVTALLQADGATGFDNAHYCEVGFLPNIDGGDFVLWSTPGLHQALATFYFEGYVNVAPGYHNVNIGMFRIVGPGNPRTFYGVDSQGYGRQGIYYKVEDAGVVF